MTNDNDYTKAVKRCSSLMHLEPGWYGAGSMAISLVAIEAAASLLVLFAEESFPVPGIFPMYEGGVKFEWDYQTIDDPFLELVFATDGKTRAFACIGSTATGDLELTEENITQARAVELVKLYVEGKLFAPTTDVGGAGSQGQ